MKRLVRDELIKKDNTEDVFVISLHDGKVNVLADIEENNNIVSDGYRIELFNGGVEGWELDEEKVDNIMSSSSPNSFIEIFEAEREKHNGDITFLHDTIQEINVFESAIFQLYITYTEDKAIIFSLNDKEFADVYKYLKDGVYILVFE